MSLNVIPETMRARHHETGEWHVLRLSDDRYPFGVRAPHTLFDRYFIDPKTDDFGVDLHDFDSFEGVVS